VDQTRARSSKPRAICSRRLDTPVLRSGFFPHVMHFLCNVWRDFLIYRVMADYFANSIPLPTGIADLQRCEMRYPGGNYCRLSLREAELLRYLASNMGRLVSRDELLLHVWHMNPACTFTRTVDMHIAHLREKLRDDPANPRLLFTVYGQGYVFDANGMQMGFLDFHRTADLPQARWAGHPLPSEGRGRG
jgi:DNA-binding winged helix-turn-helix (wHTH) protein